MTNNHRRLGLALPLVATTLLLAAEASGQTPLVDAARRERARRAAIPADEKARVYTNEDLRDSGGLTIGVLPSSAAPGSDPAGPPSSGPGGGPEAPADEDELDAAQPEATVARGEDYWRARIAAARDAQARAALMAAALQNRADGLWAQFTAIDDPLRRGAVERQRLEALGALEETRAERDRLDGEIREIEDEARRAGVPPGWLRGTATP
ncbi:MAG: hypothetical protein OXH04_10600 [Acidobacteria bacterium]|nr:hypothetical protein [Acidobacteriota bacterium]